MFGSSDFCENSPLLSESHQKSTPVILERSLQNLQSCRLCLTLEVAQFFPQGLHIAVIDGVRRFGNGKCLPAGPLREPRKRLQSVDVVVTNGVPGPREYRMTLKQGRAKNLIESDKSRSLTDFTGKTVHAIAGIGNPDRFFDQLEEYDIDVIRHPFPDHYFYNEEDIGFDDDLPVLMTEKDAVKCVNIASGRHWFVPVDAELDDRITPLILRLIGHHS